MATLGGAEAIHLDSEIGSIEVGKLLVFQRYSITTVRSALYIHAEGSRLQRILPGYYESL
jgi:cytosine/adenosine deaminase-related metal-dependent hydrolase